MKKDEATGVCDVDRNILKNRYRHCKIKTGIGAWGKVSRGGVNCLAHPFLRGIFPLLTYSVHMERSQSSTIMHDSRHLLPIQS
jgi:hypothetical protein